MNLQSRKLTDLKVYENNPRSNLEAVAKVKLSILSYGYKVPIVIDHDNYIVAGHTRFAALLQINRETGQYDSISCVLADDLDDNQVKQFRIVDNQVAALAEWDFTKLRMELDTLDGFILDEFGEIDGFEIDFNIDEDTPLPEETTNIKIQIGSEKFEMTETEYHDWCSYVLQIKGTSVIDFVKSALQIKREDRQYSNLGL